MKQYLLMGLLLCCIGCGSGTDVGNPVEAATQSTTTRDEFLGTYQTNSAALASPDDSGIQADAVASCTTQTGAERAIDAGASATAVQLSGIFGYSDIADPIAGTVTDGTLSIDVSGTTTHLVCTGTLSSVTLTFTCDVTVNGSTSQCQLSLEQL